MSDLRGKVVLISGASSGIGRGAALEFAQHGAKLALTGRKVGNLELTVSQCEKLGVSRADILSIEADFAKEEDIKKVLDQTVLKFGQLDVLVNNAGMAALGTVETHTMEDYDKVMNINVRSHFYMTQLAVPHLVKTKGTVVNVSSVNGIRSFPGLIAYNMSKAAIDQFTRCSALELAQKGVRVNSVNPGVIQTMIHKRSGMDEEAYAKFLEHSKTTHALGRVGQPEEVAKAIVFLASSDSSFITGASIPIDGASSGLGQAAALEFARHGAKLALTGRKVENLLLTVSQCEELGVPKHNILSIEADLLKDEDVKKVVNQTIQHFGQLDVLLNNAGVIIPGSIETQTLEEYDQTMNLNVRSYFLITQLAVPHLIKTKGSIVNLSSGAGLRSFPNVLAYCMSKATIDQFTRCTALELAQKGVRVNAVNPGVIVTDLHKRGGMDEQAYAKFLEKCKTTHPLGRAGQPDEVAKTIVFLASSDSSFITGATIPIDGGRHATCPR